MPFKLMRGGPVNRQWADRARIDFVPTTYTRAITPGDTERLIEHSSHLKGIDNYVGTLGTTKQTDAYTDVATDNGSTTAIGPDTITLLGRGLFDTEVDTTNGDVLVGAEALQHRLIARRTAGTGDLEQVTIGDLPFKAAPIGLDRAVGWDSTDGALSEFNPESFGAPSYASIWAPGKRYFTTAHVGSETSTGQDYSTVGGDQAIYYSQFFVPQSGYTFSNLSFEVVLGGGIGVAMHIAVYTDTNGGPGDFLLSGSTGFTLPGIYQIPVAALELNAGHHWFAFQINADAITFTTAVLSQTAPYLGEKDDTTDFAQGVTQRTESLNITYPTFPATASAANESRKKLVLIGLSRA